MSWSKGSVAGLGVPMRSSHWIILGVFIARGKEDVLVTLNQVVGESVYGEKRMSVDVSSSDFTDWDSFLIKVIIVSYNNILELKEGEKKIEYRVWNPFRSKLAAAIMGGKKLVDKSMNTSLH